MRARSVVLRIFHALEARASQSLSFACVWMCTRVCACGVSMDCVGCVRLVVPSQKTIESSLLLEKLKIIRIYHDLFLRFPLLIVTR